MKSKWKKWLEFTKKIVSVQASVLLFLIYYILVLPMALFIQFFFKERFLGHNIKTRKKSYWVIRDKQKYDMKWAREQ